MGSSIEDPNQDGARCPSGQYVVACLDAAGCQKTRSRRTQVLRDLKAWWAREERWRERGWVGVVSHTLDERKLK